MKVAMISLGCSKNQVDAEIMLASLKSAGYELVGDPAKAEIVIINTCGFIESAKAEAIENILEVASLKADDTTPVSHIIVAGCLAQRYQDEIADELPEVDAFLGIASRDKIVDAIKAVSQQNKYCDFAPLCEYTPGGDRLLSTPFYTAYLKIADGCDNRCSYCAIPYIRGKFISRPIDEIVAEAKALAENGVFELNVIAQDTTRYGLDLYGERKLPELLSRLCEIEGIKWIRILYAYPDGITDELIDVMASNDKIVNYIDLPLQHASDNVLKAMRRRGTQSDILSTIEKIREKMPNASLRTTFITGFPGESEQDFKTLCDFVEKVRFDKVGVFAYSAEEGTPAAEFDNQIDEDVKNARKEEIEKIACRIADEKNKKLLGKETSVVVEGYDRLAECWFGRSRYYAPEVDGEIFFTASSPIQIGEITTVKITEVVEYDLYGEAV